MCDCAPPQCDFTATFRKWHLHGKDGWISLPLLLRSFLLASLFHTCHFTLQVLCWNAGLQSSLFFLCALSHCLIIFLFKVPHKCSLLRTLQCSLLGLNLVLIPCFFRPLVSLSMQVTAAFFPWMIMTLFPNSGLKYFFLFFKVTFCFRKVVYMSQIL